MRRRCLEHQQRDNRVGWGATDGNAKSGMAMDARAPPRLQCIVETLLVRRVFCIRLRASRVHIVPRLYANYS